MGGTRLKKFISTFLTLLILLISNLLLSKYFNLSFLELSFITGLISSILVGFFSSEGGPLTEAVNARFKHLMEKESRTNTHFSRFYINVPFIACVCYTVVSGIVSIISYWEYF